MGPVAESLLTVVFAIGGLGALAYFPFRPQWARLRRSIIAWQLRDEEREKEEQACREAAAREVKQWTSVDLEDLNNNEKPKV
jgi:hypothetical protein